MKKLRFPLSILAVAMVAAAWKWSLILEARLNLRLEHGEPLNFEIVRGTGGVRMPLPAVVDGLTPTSTPVIPPAAPLTDAFILSTGGSSSFRSGYEEERWQVEQLDFRPSAAQAWKTLPEKIWRSNCNFFLQIGRVLPLAGERREVFSVFDYSTQGDLLVGQYKVRGRLNSEFHDTQSGVRYLGAGTFDFDFHVNPAPQGKKRVILDAVRKIG